MWQFINILFNKICIYFGYETCTLYEKLSIIIKVSLELNRLILQKWDIYFSLALIKKH